MPKVNPTMKTTNKDLKPNAVFSPVIADKTENSKEAAIPTMGGIIRSGSAGKPAGAVECEKSIDFHLG